MGKTSQTRKSSSKKRIKKGQEINISNTTRTPTPRVPLIELAAKLLPPEFSLSVVYIGETKSKQLNMLYLGKSYPTNVLAFPLSESSAEIYLSLSKAKKEAPTFSHTYKEHVFFLLIHAVLHIKGFKHGLPMEKEEKKLMRIFGVQ